MLTGQEITVLCAAAKRFRALHADVYFSHDDFATDALISAQMADEDVL
jgi:hypothetical protein